MTKLIRSWINPALIVIGNRVSNSIVPNEWILKLIKSAIAKLAPANTAYIPYNNGAANININSIGSVTPVKNTARPADKNIDLYLTRLSLSTLRYIASAIPMSAADDRIICPTLNLAGVTLLSNSLYACVSPAAAKLFKSETHANHNGSCPATIFPLPDPVKIEIGRASCRERVERSLGEVGTQRDRRYR